MSSPRNTPGALHVAGDPRTWEVRWEHGRILRPEGDALPLCWGDTPDMVLAHNAIDAWAAAASLETQLPRAGAFSLWWLLRIKLVQVHLPAWLPVLRALRAQAGGYTTLWLHAPPAPWWPALLQTAYPEARIQVWSEPRPARGHRVRALAARLLRALTTMRRLGRMAPAQAGRARVLVVSRARSWDGHADIEMGPVLAALASRGVELLILDQTHEGLIANLHTWRTRPRTHLFGDYLFLKYLLQHGRLQPPLPPVLRHAQLTSLPLVIDGFDLTGLVLSQLQRDAAAAYQGFTTCLATLPGLLQQLRVDALLTTDETGGELGIVMGAVAAGIPTVALQHGCIHPDHLAYIFPKGTNPSEIPLCDHTCVYGPHYARLLTTQSIYRDASSTGHPSASHAPQVTITGQPQADARTAARRPWGQRTPAGEQCRRDVLPSGCDRLLLLSSQELLVDYLQATVLPTMAAASPRCCLVIRPHPREWDTTGWDRAIARRGLGGRVFLRKGEALDRWLDACDVHIAATSTTLAEATLAGRPNILVGVREFGDWMDCLGPGVAVDLAAFDSLDAAVAHWLDATPAQVAAFEARRQDYLAAHFHTPDQGASKRVADVVLAAAGVTPP